MVLCHVKLRFKAKIFRCIFQSGISTTAGGDVLIVVDDTINPSKIETTDDDLYLAENSDAGIQFLAIF